MTLVQFIRLLKDHAVLLIMVPLLVSSSVYFFMDDSNRSYSTYSRVYTGFASGYSLQNNAQRDFYGIKTKFDNFFENTKSRSTREEVLLRTLAYYLSKDSISERDMSIDNQRLFNQVFTEKLKSKFVVKNSVENTYLNLVAYYHKDFENEVYLLLNSRESVLKDLFGSEKMASLEARQEGTSDLIVLNYESKDAGVTYEIMQVALKVLLSKVKVIKSAESNDVVKYFMEEVKKAQKKLDDAETELGNLLTENSITNYYEQTKWLASRNEDFVVAYQKEKLGLAASEAAEKEAEVTMGISNGIKFKTSSVLTLRNAIREINSKIAELQLANQLNLRVSQGADSLPVAKPKENNGAKLNALTRELAEKELALKTEIDEMLAMKNTTTGIQMKDVASRWLEAVIMVEEYKARIYQYIQFEREFEATYARLAKLGSKIKQLERKIAVYEKDYLDLVASLNDARLVEENVQMSSSLKIVDQPFYPVDAEKSKKMMVIIVGGLAGFILCLTILILMDYLDNTIKTPERLRQFTTLNLVGGFPLLAKKDTNEDHVLHTRLIKQMATFVNYSYYDNKSAVAAVPFVVLFFSTRQQEGKTTLIHRIAGELIKAGESTLEISCNLDGFSVKGDDAERHYSYPTNVYDMNIDVLLELAQIEKSKYRYLLLEIPAIIGNDLPIQLIRNTHLSLLVSKANRIWNKADSMALANYSKITSKPVGSILNGVMVDELESIIGEIPKNRSAFRKLVKRLANLQFTSKIF